MMRTFLSGLVAVAGIAGSAHASEFAAFRAIESGDLMAAERMLVAERRIFPNRPELMLNLAAVYAKTGRVEEARLLYQAVRERRASAMRMAGGAVANSHDVAARGLEQLANPAAPVMASR